MAATQTTEDYTGWTIDYENDEASMGQMDGYDALASMNRYNDILIEQLVSQFPGATIRVSNHNTYNGSGLNISGDETTDSDVESARLSVEQIINDVFDGDYGDWAVESK